MKKLCTAILSLVLMCTVSGCSKNDLSAANTFFKALNATLQADSLEASGSVTMESSALTSADFALWLDQSGSLQLAVEADVTMYGVVLPGFFDFYIRDGKTYLNSMGTTSQSVVENIGLEPDSRITVWDPFLSLTDAQQQELFTSIQVDGDLYTMKINKDKLSVYLDEMGGAVIKTADVTARIQDGYVTELDVQISGLQTIEDASQDFDISLQMTLSNIDQTVEIPFPSNLDTYGEETTE